MFGIVKPVVRTVVLGAVVVGVVTAGAVLVAGPQRTKAMMNQMHDSAMKRIDECIDDPTAMRSQLQELEREYPAKISQVRGDLAELQEQIRQLDRERAIAERVVALAERDLGVLEPKLGEAAAVRERTDGARLVAVSFDDKVYSYDRAASRVGQIRRTRVAYANRAADAAHDLTYLLQQETRLEELLAQLEAERQEFQVQITQLERQVDAIARNERTIELLEKRNRTIEELSRYEVGSLDQITARLAEIRTRQEAELDALAAAPTKEVDYEGEARLQLAEEGYEDLPEELDLGPYAESLAPLGAAARELR